MKAGSYMRFELKDFQVKAASEMVKALDIMYRNYASTGDLSSLCLSAPTGAGKTVICTAVIETLFFGNDDPGILFPEDPDACVLWVSDLPNLVEQTRHRMLQASDLLGIGNSLVSVDNSFTVNNSVLQPKNVYFISKALLKRNSLLTRGGENEGGRTFWDIIDSTIAVGTHLYLFLDEAHQGIGKSNSGGVSEKDDKTISELLIDGANGRLPTPAVVGISATPERFCNQMEAKRRAQRPNISIRPKDVQSSGLLKEFIEISVPEEGDNRPMSNAYLMRAVESLKKSSNAWSKYTKGQGIPDVSPLLVVQVNSKCTDEHLVSLAKIITESAKGLNLNPRESFAHVFGTHTDISKAGYSIPYINPVDVQDSKGVRVLFAKEAITTGWDCPRAEVVFSECRRGDPTYVAQLIGRMVRTPLGRKISNNAVLNSVSCFLPWYRTDTVEEVVANLTDASTGVGIDRKNVVKNAVTLYAFGCSDDMSVEDCGGVGSSSSPRSTYVDPGEGEVGSENKSVESEEEGVAPKDSNLVSENSPTPGIHSPSDGKSKLERRFSKETEEAIKQAISTLYIRKVEKSFGNVFKTLRDVTTWIIEALNIPDEYRITDADIINEFNAELDKLAVVCSGFNSTVRDVIESPMAVLRVDPLSGYSKRGHSRRVKIGLDLLRSEAVVARNEFTETYFNGYWNHCSAEGKDEEYAFSRLLAAYANPEVFEGLQDWASRRAKKLLKDVKQYRVDQKEVMRGRYDSLVGQADGTTDVQAGLPRTLVVPSHGENVREYPRHIIYDAVTGKAPLALNTWENAVVNHELRKGSTVGFYRNTPSDPILGISYDVSSVKGKKAMLYPDFVFFVRDADTGGIVPAVVDPHGDFLGDSVDKWKGAIEYLQDYPDMMKYYWSVYKRNGNYWYIDLLDPEVQKDVMSGDYSAAELFEKHQSLYISVK